jgi:hypothetical protein
MGVYTWDEVAEKNEFVLALCFQLGIGHIFAQPTTPRSTKARESKFEAGVGFGGQSYPAFSFVEHRPGTFATIRRNFDMDLTVFDAALGLHDVSHKPNLRIINRKMTSGKSDSWFFFSADMRFAVKTCTSEKLIAAMDIKVSLPPSH